MSVSDIQAIIDQVEQRLQEEELSERTELAIEKLLNVIEALSADNKSLADEIKRLEEQLEQKKKAKTTAKRDDEQPPASTDHSSEKRRRKRKRKPPRKSVDRRSFKDLTIHQTIPCPVDPAGLPKDAVRLADERVIVQDIEIRPNNTCFQRQVFYSKQHNAYYRGPLPAGYDQGDFGANLRALIVSLKYCGNMSEPKIGEFLENFDVQVSRGSLSNILTQSADDFEQDYHDVLAAGLASTTYQQTDDTSVRVDGAFWHTHILCNPFYTFYSTRPRKDRLAVLEVLQNTNDLHFCFDEQTLDLLQREFTVPEKWRRRLLELEEVELSSEPLKALLDDWFGDHNGQLRTAIEQAAAITYYHQQTSVPVVKVLVCDDAGQFKLLTDKLALCWIHARAALRKTHAGGWGVTQKPWTLFASVTGITIRPCKITAPLQVSRWRLPCESSSMNCFRHVRGMRLWTIELTKRRPNAKSY